MSNKDIEKVAEINDREEEEQTDETQPVEYEPIDS